MEPLLGTSVGAGLSEGVLPGSVGFAVGPLFAVLVLGVALNDSEDPLGVLGLEDQRGIADFDVVS